MIRHTRPGVAALIATLLLAPLSAQDAAGLPGTAPLERRDEWSREMIAGISRFADRELTRAPEARESRWGRDLSSPAAYQKSIEPNRGRLRRMIGAIDTRHPAPAMELVASVGRAARVAATETYEVLAVRWPVFGQVHGEGLLLQPTGNVRARVVVLPDADETPEAAVGLAPGVGAEAQLARRLAENGVQVIVPVLLSRSDAGSGNAGLNRFTNQTHREWIYRQAYEMGRHVIGYEVQKVLAAIDWFAAENERGPRVRLGVAGHAEGGLLALHAAALDPRIEASLVSGYFESRQRVWTEPIYRNVFGLLREFGDAEIASLIVPRPLVIAPHDGPALAGPPAVRAGRSAAAAPGALTPPTAEAAQRELERARGLVGPALAAGFHFATGPEAALTSFWRALSGGYDAPAAVGTAPVPSTPPDPAAATARQLRQLRELEAHTQRLMELSEAARQAFFWDQARPQAAADWAKTTQPWRERFREEIIGRLPVASTPPAVRSRRLVETNSFVGYDVVLDVAPDLIAWGYLLVPKGIAAGERRPVVVCQHGLEGLPEDVINDDPNARAYAYYKAFGARLAERGFVVFAPHNPYRGRDEFRVLQRKLNPLGLTHYAVMVAQQERTLDWLGALPFVDAARIGYYGLSYGGKTAMRLPAVIGRYALSICSGDFNEWIRKNASVDLRYSYMFSGEYEMFEYNLGSTFNYAEMAALIAPRPFMVERGHTDGVGTDEWVSYEYAKVRRLYTRLGIPERTTIEYFDGPHTINGAGTFEFLHRHLNWPRR
jgi:dienelactone hydrolase